MLVDFKVDCWLLVFTFIFEHIVDIELWIVKVEVLVAIAVFIVTFSLLYSIGRVLSKRGSRTCF